MNVQYPGEMLIKEAIQPIASANVLSYREAVLPTAYTSR
jgi:hypothetical protein